MIYLDNAATSGKKPDQVINAVNAALKRYSANPGRSGHSASYAASELVYKARKKLCDYFNADGEEEVVFTLNCTQSINTVLKGVIKPGDHIIVSDMEHNAVMRPIITSGIDYTAFEVSFMDDGITLNNVKKAIRHNTKMIFTTAASNVFGNVLPLKKIGALAKENNLLFAVDAAQYAGILPLDMKDYNIDYLCVAPHKGLYAPMGTGVLIARRKIDKTIIEGGTGTDSINLSQPQDLPERFESGTVNLPGIAGISAGVDFVSKNAGMIYKKDMALISGLYEFLSAADGVILYTPYPENNRYVPVLSFNVEGLSSQTTAQLLNEEGIAVRAGLHCAPCAHGKAGTLDTGTVRISPGYFNEYGEIRRLEQTIKKICANRKKYIEG